MVSTSKQRKRQMHAILLRNVELDSFWVQDKMATLPFRSETAAVSTSIRIQSATNRWTGSHNNLKALIKRKGQYFYRSKPSAMRPHAKVLTSGWKPTESVTSEKLTPTESTLVSSTNESTRNE
nr:hypothetical protein Iba_chr10aCG2260 [Ipomoea batatas]GMD47850.1 hypothetical protein Iba_chr10fCG0740 [Ipomoea batatas]